MVNSSYIGKFSKYDDLHDGTKDEQNTEDDENKNHEDKNNLHLLEEDTSNISIHYYLLDSIYNHHFFPSPPLSPTFLHLLE